MLPLLGLCALPLAVAKSAVQQPPGMMRGGDDDTVEIDLMGDGPVMMGGPPGILGGPMMGGPRSSHPREQALDAMMMEMLSSAMGGPGRGGPPGMIMEMDGPSGMKGSRGPPPGLVQLFGDDDDGPGGSRVIPMGDGEVVFEIDDDDAPPGRGPQRGPPGGMDQLALALMGGSPPSGPFGGPRRGTSLTQSNHRQQERMDAMRMQSLMDNSLNDIQAALAPHKDGFPHSCMPEVQRRCSGGSDSWSAMKKYACLLPYLDQVSTQCNKDLEHSVPNVCKDEISKYCDLLSTSILDCLGGQIMKLQGTCKEAASDALHISNANKTKKAYATTAAPGKDLGSLIGKEMMDLESAISGAKLHKVPSPPPEEGPTLLPDSLEPVFSKDMSILQNALNRGSIYHKNEPAKPPQGFVENPELDQKTQDELDGEYDALERALTGHKKPGIKIPSEVSPIVKNMVSKEREPTEEEKKVEQEIDKETAMLMKALEGAHFQKQGVKTNSAIKTESRSLKAVDTTLFRGAKTILVFAAIVALIAIAAVGFSAAAPVTAEKHMEKIRRLMTVRDSESEYLLEGGELQFKAPPML